MTNSVKGVEQIIADAKKLGIDIDDSLDRAVRVTAFKVLDNAVRAIQTESPGRMVPSRQAKGKTHTVSLPGDAPNTDTGRLASSVQVAHNRGDKVAFIGTNVPYGAHLELNLNRPWLKPALDVENEELPDRIARMVEKAVEARLK